ncbi:1983_t:CDS:10 [Funneliformis geosporum]|uniref:20_t:CDS:1 n=1 Tax=Funneliformis geosporum TaxID=1117311 RepID=A0A9W4WV28_9GLOM|nr:1983_t:CDS:10 [Funneliformis geosporum]CAI2165815.1 20_t:CDS:10 [Funneliformis geosporum]
MTEQIIQACNASEEQNQQGVSISTQTEEPKDMNQPGASISTQTEELKDTKQGASISTQTEEPTNQQGASISTQTEEPKDTEQKRTSISTQTEELKATNQQGASINVQTEEPKATNQQGASINVQTEEPKDTNQQGASIITQTEESKGLSQSINNNVENKKVTVEDVGSEETLVKNNGPNDNSNDTNSNDTSNATEDFLDLHDEGPKEENEDLLYDPSRPITHRIEEAIQKFRKNRKFTPIRNQVFTSYLRFGGISTGQKQFLSQDGADKEDEDAQDIAARRSTDFVEDDEDMEVDFTYTVQVYLSGFLIDKSGYVQMDQFREGPQVVISFLNYLCNRNVCPEYEADMRNALRIASKAAIELPNCKSLAHSAPGKFNKACSLLFGGELYGVLDDPWNGEDKVASMIGISKREGTQLIKYVFGANAFEELKLVEEDSKYTLTCEIIEVVPYSKAIGEISAGNNNESPNPKNEAQQANDEKSAVNSNESPNPDNEAQQANDEKSAVNSNESPNPDNEAQQANDEKSAVNSNESPNQNNEAQTNDGNSAVNSNELTNSIDESIKKETSFTKIFLRERDVKKAEPFYITVNPELGGFATPGMIITADFYKLSNGFWYWDKVTNILQNKINLLKMSHLGNTNSSLNVSSLRELARKQLTTVLDSVRGKKCLVLDPNISAPLSLIAEFSLLKEHGVEKVHYLQQGPLETDLKSLIYICRPQLNYMKYIAGHHQKNDPSSVYEYNLFFVPRRTKICERVLEDSGVFGDILYVFYHLDLIPFEDDLLSLELDNTFKELYLDGDYTSIYYAARALMKLQTKFGLFPRVIGKGDCAKHLADMLLRMRKEVAVDDPSSTLSVSQSIDSLIIIDRSVDLITPLCTQLTYEGLIDEVFSIRASHVEVDSSIVGPASQKSVATTSATTSTTTTTPAQPSPPPPAKKKKIALNSTDKLFVQLRDMNFAVVGGVLNRVARRINEDYEGRHQAKTVAQIREFINKLGGLQSEHQSLRTHTGIAEEIMAYTVTPEFNKALEVQQNLAAGIDINLQNDHIEEMINRQVPIVQVLRLLCLLSIVNGGLKQKSFEFFKKEILQSYGFEHLQTLLNLERLNMFVKQGSTNNKFSSIRKQLQLIVDEVDEHNPQDISYVYSGYAPLSVRLIQCVTKGCPTSINPVVTGAANNVAGTGVSTRSIGWKGYEDVLRMLPGKSFDEVQRLDDGTIRSKKLIQGQQPRVTLIFFLGGCTYTEIAAIRFMAQQEEGQREYIIATTQIINGNSLLNSIMQKIDHLGHSTSGSS